MTVPTIMSTADIRFRDHAGSEVGRNEVVMFCDFRVFIMGVEVTSFVKDSIAYTKSLNGSENTCTFTLDNAYERFVMTPQNFQAYRSAPADIAYRFDQSQDPERLSKTGLNFSSLADFDASRMTWVQSEGHHSVDESAKKALFEYKIKHTLEFSQAAAHQAAAISGTNTSQMASKIPKYKLTVGSCVIGLNDEVRVFVADPNHDPVNSVYRWMPVFSGVVSSAQAQRSRVEGSSTISVTCADIRYLLRKMRVTGNIQSTNQVQTYIRFDDAIGMFQDAAFIASASDGNVSLENLASQVSYRQLTRGLLCGDNPTDIAAIDAKNADINPDKSTNNFVRAVSFETNRNPWADKIKPPDHANDKVLQIKGVGNLTLGFEISNVRPEQGSWAARVQQMSTWQDLIMFGIKMDWYTDAEVTRIGAGTKPVYVADVKGISTGAMSPFSIMNSFVHYLFPGNQGNTGEELGIKNLMERGLINPGSDTSWTTRLDMLVQCSETIDYKIQVNGMGDICFEFPMYDFTPNFFGKYAECFALGDSIKNDDVNDEGEGNVVTCLKVTGAYRDIKESAAEAKSEAVVADQQYSIFIKSDYMASKYGIVVEEYPIPWALDVWSLRNVDAATGATVNTDAIHKNTLMSFGVIEFYKRIAAMSSMSTDVAYNPFLCPNRPLLNKLARRLGLIESVNITLTIDGAPSSSADTKWIRHASQNDEDAADGHIYQTLTGVTNTPFGYVVDGLKLFSSEAIDSIRTTFGIEIIDPSKNKIDDATKSALKNLGGFNSDQYQSLLQHGQQTQQVNTGDGRSYSVSSVVKASYKRYEKLAQTDPETYAAVNRIAQAAGADPQDMYRLMEHESGGGNHIDPQGAFRYKDKPNKIGAQGIIQFMPDTLKHLEGRNGVPINPATFLVDYPTVVDQADLAVQYYTRMRNQFGPLNTPYKLIMSTANPASLNDDMFADFSQSSNKWTREHADLIKSLNRVSVPADFCKAKGYNYVQGAGGTDVDGTKYYPTGGDALKQATQITMPGMPTLQQTLDKSAPSNTANTSTVPRTSALR